MTQPTIFVSYSHKDEREKDALVSHLDVLANEGLVNVWVDDRIGGGDDWKQKINQSIAQAKVAILLITANFLTSDFILNQEVPKLLKRRQSEGLVVFPVIAKACAWDTVSWLKQMNVRPKDGKPVWSDKGSHADEDLTAIAKEVALIVDKDKTDFESSTRSIESSGLDRKIQSTENISSNKSVVEITIKGDVSTFTFKQQSNLLNILALNLECSPDILTVIAVRGGSIILEIQMPTVLAERLIKLHKAGDPKMQEAGIEQVRLIAGQALTVTPVSKSSRPAASTGFVVLLIDDDVFGSKIFDLVLTPMGFRVEMAHNAIDGLKKAYALQPDVILLDIMMPDIDGLETLQRLKEMSDVPIIMLTSVDSPGSTIKSLDLGADDYIVKTANTEELAARIRTVLRRASPSNIITRKQKPIITQDNVTIDFDKQEVTVDGERVNLSPAEFKLLSVLARHKGRVLPHEFLLTQVWGPEYIGEIDYLRLYISYLRRKLEKDPSHPTLIYNEWGVGYRFG